ncbi:MAG: hypothetical protein IPP69_16815 [Flavobacteriales bacterium]|nr:hypothetical protein [Flavobacteriales bacterium]
MKIEYFLLRIIYKLKPRSIKSVKIESIAKTIKKHEHLFKVFGLLSFGLTMFIGVLWALGCEFEPITFIMGGISSSFFGIIEIAKYITPDRKQIRDMSLDEMLQVIEESNPTTDWKKFSTEYATELVLLEDPRLRLTIYQDERGTQCDNFKEPWANCFPDPTAHGYWVNISYDRAVLDRKILVSVDGGRAMLPVPKARNNLFVSKRDYAIAKLFDSLSTLDEYMRGAKLSQSID